MEYMAKGTLEDNWTVSQEQKLQWAYQLALGLQYLHSQHPPMLHCDIKRCSL